MTLIAIDNDALAELAQKARSGIIRPEALGADLEALRAAAPPAESQRKVEQLRGLVRIKQRALMKYGRCTCPVHPKKDSVRCNYCIAVAAQEIPTAVHTQTSVTP
jgi:hypothetical protein